MRNFARLPHRPLRPVLYHPPTGGFAPVPFAVFFNDGRPRTVELGIGRADWLFAQAAAHPDRAYLGIEAAVPMAVRVVRLAATRALDNLFIAFGDARLLLIDTTPVGAIDELCCFFPDPWHKKRHRDRRLTAPVMFPFIIRAVRPGGTFHFRTDHAGLFYDTIIAADAAGLSHSAPTFNRNPDHALTAWERKSLEGRSRGGEGTIADIVFTRGADLPTPTDLESPIDPREPTDARPLDLEPQPEPRA